MGYYIELIDSQFFIAAEDKAAALEALCKMWDPGRESGMSGGSYGQGVDIKWYSWMNNSADDWRNRTIASLEDGLAEWGYPVETDEDGNIIDIYFDGGKIGDEDQMFAALAPFVRAGSFLDYRGEEGALWRWAFNGTTFGERHGKVVFE